MGGGGGSSQRRKAHDVYTQKIKTSSESLPLFDQDDCADFTLAVRLLNPQPALNVVIKGDVLTVQLDPGEILVVLNKNGEVCGNIAHPKAPSLISCIKKGNKFSASVLTITNNACEVFIKNIKS